MNNDPIEKEATNIMEYLNLGPAHAGRVRGYVEGRIREAVEAETKDLREKLKVAREEYADLEALYGYELEKANDER